MHKLERLDRFLETRALSSVWFARPNSFVWFSGGRNVVDRESPVGVGALGYDGEQVTLLADNIELKRLREEELPDLEGVPVRQQSFDWYEGSLPAAIADTASQPAGADIEVPGLEEIDPAALRQPLTETDIERYRRLGRETAAAVEAVCRELEPDDAEDEVRAALTVSLAARNIEAPVVLVGGAARAQRFRHYTPTSTSFGEYALVSVTTERHGLHASCTRAVAFDPPSWLGERHHAAARVETTALAATQAAASTDGTAGDVFADIQAAYAGLGYDGEWKAHHQGGAAGFAGREWIGTPTLERSVRTPMAYAWNPTVQGAKSEDTVLVSDDGYEVLTQTGDWPTVTVGAVSDAVGTHLEDGMRIDEETRGLELERPAVLGLENG